MGYIIISSEKNIQIKEDLESGGTGLSDKAKKEAESMGLPKNLAKVTLKGHRQGIKCLYFHPFYKRLASGSDDVSIIIWECDEFTEERSLRVHSDKKLLNSSEKFVVTISMSPKCKWLASGSNDLTIKVWDWS